MVKIARPRLVIEAVVSNGVVKAVRCKAEVDAGVEITFIGAAEEEADARLKKADKPSEGGGQHAKMAEELKAADPRVEKIQPAEEAGFEMGDTSVDYGRLVEEGVRQFPYTWAWRTAMCMLG